jgi:ATP-dependent DNA helicase RecQ
METKPQTRQQMALISGIGTRKLELYGDEFLAVIRAFADNNNSLNDTATDSVNLIKLGFSVAAVASQRGLKEATILSHLAQSIERGQCRLADAIDLSATEIARIEASILALPADQQHTLKPVYEAFGGAYDYNVLRCVRAALVYKTS